MPADAVACCRTQSHVLTQSHHQLLVALPLSLSVQRSLLSQALTYKLQRADAAAQLHQWLPVVLEVRLRLSLRLLLRMRCQYWLVAVVAQQTGFDPADAAAQIPLHLPLAPLLSLWLLLGLSLRVMQRCATASRKCCGVFRRVTARRHCSTRKWCGVSRRESRRDTRGVTVAAATR
jgi:hypothetical protein